MDDLSTVEHEQRDDARHKGDLPWSTRAVPDSASSAGWLVNAPRSFPTTLRATGRPASTDTLTAVG